jgi:hypothetical protein
MRERDRMSMLMQPFSELGATNEGQRVDAGQVHAPPPSPNA